MTDEIRKVSVTSDHLDRIAKASPEAAIAELIWNALDSGSLRVDVSISDHEMYGIREIKVKDSGEGVIFENIDKTFGDVGDSIKKIFTKTRDGRIVHGSLGEGRYKALSLGDVVEWDTVYNHNGENRHYKLKISGESSDTYVCSKPAPSKRTTGTCVTIFNVKDSAKRLKSPSTIESLTQEFALYLQKYPEVSIIYNNNKITVNDLVRHQDEKLLKFKEYPNISTILRIVEWVFKTEKKILLCDENNFARCEYDSSIKAPDFYITAYVSSSKIGELYLSNNLEKGMLEEYIRLTIEATRASLREYYKKRVAEEALKIVENWKKEEIYPYTDDETKNPITKTASQVFDIVAARINEFHPTFKDSSAESKRMTLKLLRHTIENEPSNIMKIVNDLISLPNYSKDNLIKLIDRTNLDSIIKSACIVADRLDAINMFEQILFDKDWRIRLKERTQLQRILVKELWIFGDEYELGADDESLKSILEKHLELLCRKELAKEIRQLGRIKNLSGIPDLMLYRYIPRDSRRIEHLVIEIKKPDVRIGHKEITQIERYALAVSSDMNFSKKDVEWKFILISCEFDDYAKMKAENDNMPPGCITKKGNLSVWIKEWGEVLHDARLRCEFFRRQLGLNATRDTGTRYLNRHYHDLLIGKRLTSRSKSKRTD